MQRIIYIDVIAFLFLKKGLEKKALSEVEIFIIANINPDHYHS